LNPENSAIPDGTWLPANGYAVFYEYQFDPTPGVFPSFASRFLLTAIRFISRLLTFGGTLYGFRTA